MPHRSHIALGLLGVVALGIGVGSQRRIPSFGAGTPEAEAMPQGYLPNAGDWDIAPLPPPPEAGSAAMQRDEDARRDALALQGTARYELAAADSIRSQPQSVKSFSCALATDIGLEATPRLYHLLAGVRFGVRSTAYLLKSHYSRPRPFVASGSRSCSQSDQELRSSGSYPSAGSAVGWAYALILSEIVPAKRDAIMRRGLEYGQSRIVCDAEWQSDVDAGRHVATEAVRQMHADQSFRTDLEAARKEVAEAIASGRSPGDCGLEGRALASR